MRKKETDVLKQKQDELNTYLGQANDAVSMITDTVASLNTINESIDEKIREIDNYQLGLTTTKNGLTDARAKNERIIKNFNALLSVE